MFKRKFKPYYEEMKPKPHTELLFSEAMDISYIDKRCPECDKWPILVHLTCHTYEQNGRWAACIPCSSAGDLSCQTEDCNWSYTWGLNTRNPRSTNNELDRPDWLVGDWPM